MPSDFLGHPHLEKIRRELWHRPSAHGRVSVMVGAGFSRNAQPLGPSVGLFPLWSELGGRLYDELYPTDTDPVSTRRSLALAGNGPVRLASEYEAAFGREQLDSLVQAVIPNDSYAPGRLHRLLMTLPWADVFTTNYDTLLERTGHQVHRRYGLVQTSADLPGRMKPRIVKLHGSFPSHRPFILTEEDSLYHFDLEHLTKPLEMVVADEHATEREEGLVDVGSPLVAHAQAAKAVEPGERAFHDPAVTTETLRAVLAAAGDARQDATRTQGRPTTRVVVALVGVQLLGPAARPSAPASDGQHGVESLL